MADTSDTAERALAAVSRSGLFHLTLEILQYFELGSSGFVTDNSSALTQSRDSHQADRRELPNLNIKKAVPEAFVTPDKLTVRSCLKWQAGVDV